MTLAMVRVNVIFSDNEDKTRAPWQCAVPALHVELSIHEQSVGHTSRKMEQWCQTMPSRRLQTHTHTHFCTLSVDVGSALREKSLETSLFICLCCVFPFSFKTEKIVDITFFLDSFHTCSLRWLVPLCCNNSNIPFAIVNHNKFPDPSTN